MAHTLFTESLSTKIVPFSLFRYLEGVEFLTNWSKIKDKENFHLGVPIERTRNGHHFSIKGGLLKGISMLLLTFPGVGLTLNATGGQVHVIVFQQTKFRAQRFTTRT